MSLDVVFQLDSTAEMLARPNLSLEDVQRAISRLKAFPLPPVKQTAAPGVDIPKPAREIITRAIQDLSKISKPKDVAKAASADESLGRLVDTLLADAVRSLVYALELGDPDRTVLAGVDVSARHDFGFAAPETLRRSEIPWAEPGEVIVPGEPRQVRGSLLNLDLALSKLALKQVSQQHADRPPVLTDNERATFATSAILLNAFEMRDDDRDGIVDAIARGRRRVQSLAEGSLAESLDRLREDIAMDGWRRRAVQWAVEHHGDPIAFFSLGELMQLGARRPRKRSTGGARPRGTAIVASAPGSIR